MNPNNHPTVNDVRVLEAAGPWKTKSDGELNVLFKLPFDDIMGKFFSYNQSELDKIPADIRGLRSYRVSRLANAAIGAKEWHKVRNELAITTRGSIKWTCQDIYGGSVTHVLDESHGLWIPPYILHTYEALQDDSEVLVIANTLFIPDDPATHDSYSDESFASLGQ